MAHRRRSTAPRRHTDWSGIHINEEVTVAQSVLQVPIWTPVAEDKKATVVRIVGDLHIIPSTDQMQNPGAFAFNVFAGIQVINRAQGVAGNPRLPQQPDDLEGGEWLWLRSYCFRWVNQGVTGDVRMHGASPDMFGGNGSHLDIRVKRKLDLSQDELQLTVQGNGTFLTVEVCGMLRMLLMAY